MPLSAVQDFPPSARSPSRLIGGELLALAASSLLYPFGLGASRRRTARRAEQRTVVFVHGYLGNRSSFYPPAGFLRMLGPGPLLSFSYSGAHGIEHAAIELRDALRRRVRGGRIDLVCHSLGGLIARTWLQLLGGARRVDRCIMLGTPDRGTYNAYRLLSRIGRELRPDSALIRRLDETRAAASCGATRPSAGATRPNRPAGWKRRRAGRPRRRGNRPKMRADRRNRRATLSMRCVESRNICAGTPSRSV